LMTVILSRADGVEVCESRGGGPIGGNGAAETVTVLGLIRKDVELEPWLWLEAVDGGFDVVIDRRSAASKVPGRAIEIFGPSGCGGAESVFVNVRV